MWISNARNNFAPFAGLMLMGYERTSRGQNGEAASTAPTMLAPPARQPIAKSTTSRPVRSLCALTHQRGPSAALCSVA